jgi:hypothetical protein
MSTVDDLGRPFCRRVLQDYAEKFRRLGPRQHRSRLAGRIASLAKALGEPMPPEVARYYERAAAKVPR